MQIDHLIVGASNVAASVGFYCDFFGFIKTDDDPGEEGGQILALDQCELVVLPFEKSKLPNPFHFAFKVKSLGEFEILLSKAKDMGLKPGSMPSDISKPGFSEFSRGGKIHKHFYVYDPTGSIVEVMVVA